ncbi:hypothetical protein B296_00048710 [Ensete ventricosum]|uniref:Uncharacterized protein n=1 Tax=Ensete ventricosum TaxID=4639 RepID=A0A426YAW8_ENSVE|nr:hypothetical protein B296_00048710 [Ensete ventricosum]
MFGLPVAATAHRRNSKSVSSAFILWTPKSLGHYFVVQSIHVSFTPSFTQSKNEICCDFVHVLHYKGSSTSPSDLLPRNRQVAWEPRPAKLPRTSAEAALASKVVHVRPRPLIPSSPLRWNRTPRSDLFARVRSPSRVVSLMVS